MPIYQTSSFVFDDADHAASLFNLQLPGFIYSRLTNPTVSALEERIAALEDGRGATATASGHAAQILALFPLMHPGDEIIAANKLYGGSINQMGISYKKFGWNASSSTRMIQKNFRRAVTDKTKAIFIESLANPGGVVVDIEAVAGIAHDKGIPLIVDNTMATPYLCKPFEHGADIIVHSTTKFLSGNDRKLDWWLCRRFRTPDIENLILRDETNFPAHRHEPAAEYHGLTGLPRPSAMILAATRCIAMQPIQGRGCRYRGANPRLLPINGNALSLIRTRGHHRIND